MFDHSYRRDIFAEFFNEFHASLITAFVIFPLTGFY